MFRGCSIYVSRGHNFFCDQLWKHKVCTLSFVCFCCLLGNKNKSVLVKKQEDACRTLLTDFQQMMVFTVKTVENNMMICVFFLF